MNFSQKCSYSATTVFPADVCADTKTDWLFSKHFSDSFWKGSRMKGYSWKDIKQKGCLEWTAHSSLVGLLYSNTPSHTTQTKTSHHWIFVVKQDLLLTGILECIDQCKAPNINLLFAWDRLATFSSNLLQILLSFIPNDKDFSVKEWLLLWL